MQTCFLHALKIRTLTQRYKLPRLVSENYITQQGQIQDALSGGHAKYNNLPLLILHLLTFM